MKYTKKDFAEFILRNVAEDYTTLPDLQYNKMHVDNAVKLIRIRFLTVGKKDRLNIWRDPSTVEALCNAISEDEEDNFLYINDLDIFLDSCDKIIFDYNFKKTMNKSTYTSDESNVFKLEPPPEMCPNCGSVLTSEGICLNVDCSYEK